MSHPVSAHNNNAPMPNQSPVGYGLVVTKWKNNEKERGKALKSVKNRNKDKHFSVQYMQ